MKRSELAHLVRSASRIADEEYVLIIGSQSILGSFDEDDLPARVTFSREADIAFFEDDDERKSNDVDGAIGEGSAFDEANGYYGQGVSVATAILPTGWRSRIRKLPMESALPGVALCLEPHDLCLSKLAAQREKDFEFVHALLEAGIVEGHTLLARLEDMPVEGILKRRMRQWVERTVRKLKDQQI